MSLSEASGVAPKKTRTSVTLQNKLEVFRRFEAGERAVDIAGVLGIPAKTVRTIRVNQDKIKAIPQCVSPLGACRSVCG